MTLRLVDDFIIANDPSSAVWSIASIRLADGKLVYADRKSQVVREAPLGAQP